MSSESFLVQNCIKHHFIVLNKKVVKINENVFKIDREGNRFLNAMRF